MEFAPILTKGVAGGRLCHGHGLDRAFAAGAILRTHLLRPTWHFVTPADIRWLLAVTKPRIHRAGSVETLDAIDLLEMVIQDLDGLVGTVRWRSTKLSGLARRG